MFTGIVTDVGKVSRVEAGGDRLKLTIATSYAGLAEGESIAVNGACLTIVSVGEGWFAVEVIHTTRGRTTLADLSVGGEVNLERAMSASDRFGGHIVQGHVDGVAEVVSVERQADALLMDLRVDGEVAELCVPHGSITVDGVSMTVNALPGPGTVQIALIPYTIEHTTLGSLAVGDRAHVEGDIIGKFVRRLVEARQAE
jgi:riboflavin synthase